MLNSKDEKLRRSRYEDEIERKKIESAARAEGRQGSIFSTAISPLTAKLGKRNLKIRPILCARMYGNRVKIPFVSNTEGNISKGVLSSPPIKGPTTLPSQLNIGKYANAAPRFDLSDISPTTAGGISLALLNSPTKIWPVMANDQRMRGFELPLHKFG